MATGVTICYIEGLKDTMPAALGFAFTMSEPLPQNSAFGAWLRSRRKGRGLTLEELGDRAGLTHVAVGDWEPTPSAPTTWTTTTGSGWWRRR